MDLKDYCNSLTKEKLSGLAIRLCSNAYPIWSKYCGTADLTYRDTVVGMLHTAEKNLLIDTLNLCGRLQTNPDLFRSEQTILLEKFLEPISALQDEDWVLPYPVKQVFYAIYNLLEGFKQQKTGFGELTHYVSVNQAVTALSKAELMSFDEIKELIYGSI